MVIKLKNRKPMLRSIGSKLLGSYFLILLITLLISVFVYNHVSETYLINKAADSLEEDVGEITQFIKQAGRIVSETDIEDRIVQGRIANELRLASRYFDSTVVVMSNEGNIVYKTDKDLTYDGLKEVAREAVKENNYIFKREIISVKNGISGSIIAFTKVEDVVQMRQLGFSVFLISFLTGGVFAFIASLLFQRQIGRPIRKLSQVMSAYSFKEPVGDMGIKTGDEIEELSDTFQKMSNKIQTYHAQQKVFFQNASHELKTPLMSIQGYAEAIKDGIVEGEERDESLDIIITESQRLKKIVEEMIFLTKLEDEQEPFDLVSASLEDIIRGSIRAMNSLFDKHNVQVKLEMQTSGDGVYDVDKLSRGFINILGNCARYAKSEICVRMYEEKHTLNIEIQDDGIGFQNGEQERVFERFYKGQDGGTGIGLALTKTIVLRHKGEITAENSGDGGALFKIRLPGINT